MKQWKNPLAGRPALLAFARRADILSRAVFRDLTPGGRQSIAGRWNRATAWHRRPSAEGRAAYNPGVKLSIIIPAYTEERQIRALLKKVNNVQPDL